MDVSKVMDGLDCQNALGHIETRHIFGKDIVLHEHGHQIASGKELHDQIEVQWILEGIEELYDPGGR